MESMQDHWRGIWREQIVLPHAARAKEHFASGRRVLVVNEAVPDPDIMAEVIEGIESHGWSLDKLSTHAWSDSRSNSGHTQVLLVFRRSST